MKQLKRKRMLMAGLSVLFVLLVIIAVIALLKSLNGSNDPYIPNTASEQEITQQDEVAVDENAETTEPEVAPATDDEAAPELDPATVATIDIEPMGIRVSYVKGVGGFEYQVLRTPSGTRYVEFRSPTLVGTKCTEDAGPFISIVESPAEDESATLSKTTTVDGTEYGLSLADESCTKNKESLKEYQESFSDAFSLLKKLN